MKFLIIILSLNLSFVKEVELDTGSCAWAEEISTVCLAPFLGIPCAYRVLDAPGAQNSVGFQMCGSSATPKIQVRQTEGTASSYRSWEGNKKVFGFGVLFSFESTSTGLLLASLTLTDIHPPLYVPLPQSAPVSMKGTPTKKDTWGIRYVTRVACSYGHLSFCW